MNISNQIAFNLMQAQAMVEIVKKMGWTYVSTVAAQVFYFKGKVTRDYNGTKNGYA